ncbi:MAG: phosphotransferase enzyme family protein [Paenibacillaceae bacterium]|nr:phosphotransferase enzyme family protein [Paenibacillaceae bacterium]
MKPLSGVIWKEKSETVDWLLQHSLAAVATPLPSGLEAEVVKIDLGEISCVMKVWNRSSKPDVGRQVQMLRQMYDRGLPVSEPLGWGMDEEGHSVLLTPYDGSPIKTANRTAFARIAEILMDIHRLPLENGVEAVFPKYHFIDYFFSKINDHPDLQDLLVRLVNQSDIRQDRLIHGDYNLGNILEKRGKYTVIDWTNGQLGDPRYDMAWSIVTTRIYGGEEDGEVYHSAWLSISSYSAAEIELFEAIACLRWILLNRRFDLSKGEKTVSRVREIMKGNRYLESNLL